jgi:hypothetical protein
LGRSGGHAGFCDYVMRPPLLDLVAESLSRAASTRKEDQPHIRAFVLWMELDTASARLGFGELASTRTAPDAPTSAAAVAALGFSAATADPDPNITNRFAEELEWLRGRQFFAPHRPRGFEADGTALLGVALGIASLRGNRSGGCMRLAFWSPYAGSRRNAENVVASRLDASGGTGSPRHWRIDDDILRSQSRSRLEGSSNGF